jgi:hypothetical protein
MHSYGSSFVNLSSYIAIREFYDYRTKKILLRAWRLASFVVASGPSDSSFRESTWDLLHASIQTDLWYRPFYGGMLRVNANRPRFSLGDWMGNASSESAPVLHQKDTI